MLVGCCRMWLEELTMARMESVSSDRVLFCGCFVNRSVHGADMVGERTITHFPLRFLRVFDGGAAIVLAESMVES